MNLTEKYFKKIEPELLLKWGCPPLSFVQIIWHRVIEEPVCNWGRPVAIKQAALIVEVDAREFIAPFRSEADTILRKLNRYPLGLKKLQVRMSK